MFVGMRQVAPGIVHWTAKHPRIGIEVSSYLLVASGVLLDPLPPAAGFDALAEWGEPRMVVLTNRHHHRAAAEAAERFGIPVRVSEPGVGEASQHVAVQPFAWDEELAPGVRALEVGAICPDESAVLFTTEHALACADGVIRMGDGPLQFVPDQLIGDDPETVKAGLRDAYLRLLDLPFEHLLLAHGDPVIGNGHEALAAFAGP